MKIRLSELQAPAHALRGDEAVKVEELAVSMKEQGQLQAILVRETEKGYQVIDGRRRQLAALSLGWEDIETSVVEATTGEALIKALVANVQREDLSPLEQAHTVQMILAETHWPLRELGRRGIMTHARASQLLSLFDDPPEVIAFLDKGLSEGHIRATRKKGLHKRDRLVLLRKAVRENQSVRDAEKDAGNRVTTKTRRKTAPEKPPEPPREEKVEEVMEEQVPTPPPPLSEAQIVVKVGRYGIVKW